MSRPWYVRLYFTVLIIIIILGRRRITLTRLG